MFNFREEWPSADPFNEDTINNSLVHVKEFQGESELELLAFLNSCEYALSTVSETNQPHLLRAVMKTKITGKALMKLRDESVSNFKELEELLSSFFKKRRSLEEVQKEFNDRKQTLRETAWDYGKSMEKLLDELRSFTLANEIDTKVKMVVEVNLNIQAVQNYIKGLHLHSLLESRKFKTLQSAIDAATLKEKELLSLIASPCKKCDMTGHLTKDCPTVLPAGGNIPRCERCKVLGHTAKDCLVVLPPAANASQCERCNKTGHVAKNCRVMLPSTENVPRCEWCNKTGHVAKNCRVMLRSAVNVPRCEKCNKKGHVAKNCRVLQPPVENASQCERCNKTGHVAKNCPIRTDVLDLSESDEDKNRYDDYEYFPL